MANTDKAARRRNDSPTEESGRSAKAPVEKRRIPPPGPSDWVTDGFPYRKTDPRNWRQVAEDPAQLDSATPDSQ